MTQRRKCLGYATQLTGSAGALGVLTGPQFKARDVVQLGECTHKAQGKYPGSQKAGDGDLAHTCTPVIPAFVLRQEVKDVQGHFTFARKIFLAGSVYFMAAADD